jgi:hypothetical protein
MRMIEKEDLDGRNIWRNRTEMVWKCVRRDKGEAHRDIMK